MGKDLETTKYTTKKRSVEEGKKDNRMEESQ